MAFPISFMIQINIDFGPLRRGQITFAYAVYTPGELARISGLSTDMQRVWRRRGQLPALGSGHARFSVPEAIEITLRYALSKVGIPPSELKLDLSDAFSGAMFHALLSFDGACEVLGPADEVDAFLKAFEDDGQIAQILAGRPPATNFLIVNEWHNTRVVDEPKDALSEHEALNIVFNLQLMGGRLVEKGRKPVVTFEFPERMGIRTVRRLTGIGANDS